MMGLQLAWLQERRANVRGIRDGSGACGLSTRMDGNATSGDGAAPEKGRVL